MPGQRLGDQPGWIGKVHQDRPGGQGSHVPGDVQGDRDGAQCLGHAPHPGGLLSNEAVAPAQVLVLAACLHPAHPELVDDITRISHCLAPVC